MQSRINSPETRRRLLFRIPWSCVCTALLLCGIYLCAVGMRTASFYAQGQDHRQQFWVESAQHFRNVQMVVETGDIPLVDIDLEYPDGLETRSHTVHGEYLLGYLARWLPYQEACAFLEDRLPSQGLARDIAELFFPLQSPDLAGFVRYSIRYLNSLIVLAVFLVTVYFSRSRGLGLLTAFSYATSFPAISRALGDTFYHEHLALPCLAFHLVFLVRALDESRWKDILLGWFFLFLALLFWKVIGFYALALNAYFALSFLLNRMCSCKMRFLAVSTVGTLILSLALNIHLRYDHYWFSPTMACAYAVLIATFVERRLLKGERVWSIALFFAILIAVIRIAPEGERYTHVWDTLFAKLRYWTKPADPGLLSYEARHYWVEPYTSPPMFWFLQEVAPLLLITLIPLVWALKRIRKGTLEHGKEIWVFLSLGFLFFYLLFFKMKTFVAILLPPLVALPFSRELVMHLWDKPFRRTWLWVAGIVLGGLALVYVVLLPVSLGFSRAPEFWRKIALQWQYSKESVLLILAVIVVGTLLAACVVRKQPPRSPFRRPWLGATLLSFVAFLYAYETLSWNNSVVALGLHLSGIRQTTAKKFTRVASARSVGELLAWIPENTQPEEAFLCEFVLSPSIIQYAKRPVNQHCFFESDMRDKFRLFVENLYEPEQVMYEFCRKYQTTYLVYNAHMLLRNDPEMSFRYIANRMQWDEEWVAYQMHFRPERLRHFQLVYQNDFTRVFRVLEPDEQPTQMPRSRFSPLFSETLFTKYCPRLDSGQRDTGAYLYTLVDAFDLYDQTLAAIRIPGGENQAMNLLQQSLASSELIPDAHSLLAQMLIRSGQFQWAKASAEKALAINPEDPLAQKILEAIPTSRLR